MTSCEQRQEALRQAAQRANEMGDIRAPRFAEECARQSRIIRAAVESEKDDMNFIEKMTADEWE